MARQKKAETISSMRVSRKRTLALPQKSDSTMKTSKRPRKGRSTLKSTRKLKTSMRSVIQAFDKLSDDTILHIRQFLESPYTLAFSNAFPRITQIHSDNRERLRPAYPQWPILRELKRVDQGGVKIHLDEKQGIAFTKHEWRKPTHEIIFEKLSDKAEYGLFTDEFGALFRRQGVDFGCVRWTCELTHGTQLAVVAFVAKQMAHDQQAYFTNITDTTLSCCLQKRFEKIVLEFTGPCTLSKRGIFQLLDKSSSLKELRFKCQEEFREIDRIFFEHPQVQKLEVLRISSAVRPTGLDDTNIAQFVKTSLHLHGVDTEITLAGLKEVIKTWRGGKIPSPSWSFNIRLGKKEAATQEGIWNRLLGGRRSNGDSLEQFIKRKLPGEQLMEDTIKIILSEIGARNGILGIAIRPVDRHHRVQLAC